MKSLKEYLVPTITLFVICLVATALLGLTNQVTAPIIEQLAIETEIKSRQVVFADAKSFGEAEILADGTSVVAALDESGNTIGHVVVNSAKGYGGDVSVMTAVNPSGEVLSVAILDVSGETPGLGQNAAKEAFYSQFKGKKEGINLLKNGADADKNEIDAVTGATITSRAVTKAVNEALEQFKTVATTAKPIPEGTESEVTASEEQ